MKLIFKAKVKLESGNQKIQYGRQAAILKVTSLKINRLLPMATINMHMKFEIEIPKQTWLMLRKPCRLQTDGQTDKVNPVYPPSNFVGRGYNNLNRHIKHENLLSIYGNMDYFQIMLFTVTCWKFQKIQQPYIKRYFYVFFSTNFVEILLKLRADASSGSGAVKAFLQGSPSPSPSPSPSSSLLFSIFA